MVGNDSAQAGNGMLWRFLVGVPSMSFKVTPGVYTQIPLDGSHPETIVGVALRRRDGLIFYMPKPYRHNNVFRRASWRVPRSRWPIRGEQGFVTSTGRFVGRREAMVIAVHARQCRSYDRELFSEDLW